MSAHSFSRRKFIRRSAGAAAAFTIVPRYVLGGPGNTPPSETITRAVIGTGGQGMGHVKTNEEGKPLITLAVCDVDEKHLAKGMEKAGRGCEAYSDYRKLLERKDIDTIHIATPPHWHAPISIASMESGRDVLCEKPMTKFIAEGQAIIAAAERTKRIFQIGTFGRFGERDRWKLVKSGKLGGPLTVRIGKAQGYNWKVKEWSGRTDLEPKPVPKELDYNFWLGPAPEKPYHPHRVHGSFRCYWDYDGGGLADMGQHYLDPVQYWLGKDDESPVEVEAVAPPAHPEAVGMWGSIKMKYADGTTLILESGEWGDEPKDAPIVEGPNGQYWAAKKDQKPKRVPEDLMSGLDKVADPPPLINFEEAVRTRKKAGGNELTSHRSVCLLHLANAAIRTGRKLQFDPKTFRFVNDAEANKLAEQPMRSPWNV